MTQHPTLHHVTATCQSCGSSFAVASTAEKDISIDVCSNCHPAYTGRENLLQRGSRIERFNRRRVRAAA